MQPLVSVIVTSYNHSMFIEQALNSILAQTYPNIEIIVVDDASSDGSQKIIKKYQKENRFAFIERSVNYYSAEKKTGDKPIIQAMKSATGKYISVVDSDDYISPDKLTTQVALLEKNPQASLCYGGIDLLLADGSRHNYISNFPSGHLFDALLVQGNFLLFIGSLIRTSAFSKIERSPPALMQEDWDMFLRLAKCGPFVADARTVAFYRRHNNNTWFRADRERMMFRNRMMILDEWKQEPAWPQAMNVRWHEYLSHEKLDADDIDILLRERPDDTLLHFLKYRVCLRQQDRSNAEEHLYQALLLCDNRLAVLPELYRLMFDFIADEKSRQFLLDNMNMRISLC